MDEQEIIRLVGIFRDHAEQRRSIAEQYGGYSKYVVREGPKPLDEQVAEFEQMLRGI